MKIQKIMSVGSAIILVTSPRNSHVARYQLLDGDISIAEMQRHCGTKASEFIYTDDEGDEITFSTDVEWVAIVRRFRHAKKTVVVRTKNRALAGVPCRHRQWGRVGRNVNGTVKIPRDFWNTLK